MVWKRFRDVQKSIEKIGVNSVLWPITFLQRSSFLIPLQSLRCLLQTSCKIFWHIHTYRIVGNFGRCKSLYKWPKVVLSDSAFFTIMIVAKAIFAIFDSITIVHFSLINEI